MRFITYLLAAFSVVASGSVLAHHGDAGRYEDTITEISGTVVALLLVNPHASIIVDVEDESGETVRWQAEVSSANGMARVGWTRDTLKPGDRITIEGLPARLDPHTCYTRVVRLADGTRLFSGSATELER